MKTKTKTHNKSFTILIVEDSPTQALQVRRILEEEGFTTAVCSNGKEALSYLKQQKPTLLISDIVMPEMDGYELCSVIKGDETLKDIPVILLTALTSPEDVIKGLQAGADNFITKPYDKDFLLSRIQYIIVNQDMRKKGTTEVGLNIYFMGQTHAITSNRMQIVDLLLSTYEHAVLQNQELKKIHAELETLNKQLEDKVKQRTERVERLNYLLRAIRGVNQLIVQEKDRSLLIKKVCKTLTTASEYHNAWIALIDESGNLLTTAEAGLGKEFTPLQRLLQSGKLVTCARRALKKSGVVFIDEPSTTCTECTLAKKSHAKGAMAIRLDYEGKTYGVLSLSIPKDLMRDKEELSLFKEVAGDISYGLHSIELQKMKENSEEKLRQERDLMARIMETSPVCIIVVNSEGQITLANPGAEEVLGLSPDEVSGRTFNSPEWRITDYDGNPFPEEQLPFRQVMNTGLPIYDVRHAIEWPDGRRVLLAINSAPLFDQSGRAEGVICTIQDVTEQVKTSKTIQQSEERYRILFEQSKDPIYLSTGEGQFIDVNQAFLDLLDYTRQEIQDLNAVSVYADPDDRKKFMQSVEQKGFIQNFEVQLRKKDSTIIDCLLSATLRRSDDGTILGYQGIIRDISESVRAEKEKEKLQAQLTQSQKMEAIGTLAGGVAHDFNNLLTTIIGNADFALMDLTEDNPLHEIITEIKQAGEKSSSLTRQLLAFSRKQVTNPVVMDLNDIIKDTKKMLKRIIGEDVELKTVLDSKLEKVHADSGQIDQVIMNLAVNARDAMSKGGTLTIETANVELDEAYFHDKGISETPGPYVMLAVSDTGVGIDKAIQSRIFEPFFTTKGRGKGTGLGLSTVYGIIKQNGGFIWPYSEPGHGTTFKVYLPRVEGDAESRKKEHTLPEGPRGSETILIVEDDASIRELATKILQRYGYQVLKAGDGQEAVRITQEHDGPIHLLVTDVVMPGMNGREVAEQIQLQYPEVTVIFMSGYTDDAVDRHGVVAAGMDFLQKPFNPEVLVRKIREVLDR